MTRLSLATLTAVWAAHRIMAGQNHLLNVPMNAKSLAPESDCRLGSARLGFMILSGHDSVILSFTAGG